jgi:hypothetical protein
MVQWTGRQEVLAKGDSAWTHYTVWPDGDNHLSGSTGGLVVDRFGVTHINNIGGSVDLTCATEVLPAITWNDLFAQTMVTPPGDPP